MNKGTGSETDSSLPGKGLLHGSTLTTITDLDPCYTDRIPIVSEVNQRDDIPVSAVVSGPSLFTTLPSTAPRLSPHLPSAPAHPLLPVPAQCPVPPSCLDIGCFLLLENLSTLSASMTSSTLRGRSRCSSVRIPSLTSAHSGLAFPLTPELPSSGSDRTASTVFLSLWDLTEDHLRV